MLAPHIPEAGIRVVAACLFVWGLQGSAIDGDPWEPHQSTAWPASPWSLQTQVAQNYAAFPCANYHIVFGDEAPGCKKRMPLPATEKDGEERNSFYGSVYRDAGASWRLPVHLPGSPVRTEVRVGATISRTGSLANPRGEAQLLRSLSHWAEWHAQGTGFCLSICVKDDTSSKQNARELYRVFADPAGGYDVDILLGPLSYEFREDAAFVADIYEKPLLLWSYPSRFYTLGQGATRDRSIHDATMPVLFITVKGTSWTPEVTGASVYVDYHQEGSHWTGASKAAPVDADKRLKWNHMTHLVLYSTGAVVFSLRIREGWQPADTDPANATAIFDDLKSLRNQKREERRLPLSQPHHSHLAPPFFLEVGFELRQLPWADFYAQQADQVKKDSATLGETIRQAERSVLEADELTWRGLKFTHTGVFNGPNARVEGIHGGNDQILKSHKAEMRALAASSDDAAVQRNGSVWRVQGPCEVDASDCLTSPNYPGHYSNGNLCIATLVDMAGADTRPLSAGQQHQLVLTDLDTELLHDMLWIEGRGRFYSGQDTLENTYLSDVGLIVWQSDLTVTNRGWRLCALPVQDEFCRTFQCPQGQRPLASARTTVCTGLCTGSLCCEPVTSRSADGALWDQGYKHVFDVSVPQSQWLADALQRLYRAGGRTILAAVVEENVPQCKAALVHAEALGFQPFMQVLSVGKMDWFETALGIDLGGVDVLLVCGDAYVTTSLLSALAMLKTHIKAILLGSPLGSSLLGNILPSSAINYILEPLPWPSPEWMVKEFDNDFLKWCGWLMSYHEQPNLLSFQVQTIESLLDTALYGLTNMNATVVLNRLHVFQNAAIRTLMGEITFDAKGQRKGPVEVGTLQHHPLPVLQLETPSLSWNYWRARTIFSELVILVNSTGEVFERLETARQEVNLARLTREDPLGVEHAPHVPQNVLDSTLFMPSIETFAELTYPKTTWHEMSMEVYPCPAGCDNRGFECRACPPGRYRSVHEEHCSECPPGRVSPSWAGRTCGVCPPASVCDGPPNNPIAGIAGFWKVDAQPRLETSADSCKSEGNIFPEDLHERQGGHSYLVSCAPLVSLCLGGVDNNCYGRNAGTLCRSCDEGDTWMHFGPAAHVCRPCPSVAEVVFTNWMLMVLLYAAVCYLLNRAIIGGSKAQNSIMLPVMRLVFEHMTTEHLLIETLGFSKNNALISLGDYLTRPLDLLAVDCLFPGSSMQAIVRKTRGQLLVSVSVFVFGFIIVLTILGVRLLLHRRWDPNSSRLDQRKDADHAADVLFRKLHLSFGRQRLLQDARRHCLVWVYVTFPCMLRVGIRPLVCLEAGLDQWRLDAYPDIACLDPAYLEGVWPLALFLVFTYSLGVPLLFSVCIMKVHDYANMVKYSRIYGLLFQGYRRRFFWFEVVFIGKWILQIFCMVIVNSLNRALVALVVLLGTQVIEESFQPFLPLDRDSLRSAFRHSARIHVVTLALGLLQLLPDALAQDKQSVSDNARIILNYQFVLALVVSLLNVMFSLWVCYTLWYNKVVSPAAVMETAVGVDPLSRFQRLCVRVARFLHGINGMNYMKKDSSRHFSLKLVKLRDSEREFLTQGMLSCVENLLWVRNSRLCTLWLLEVLQASLDLLHKDHKAMTLLHGGLGSEDEGELDGSFELGIFHEGERAVKAVSHAQSKLLSALGSSLELDVGPRNSYYEVRNVFLVDEFVVALVSIGADLQDSIQSLTELEQAQTGLEVCDGEEEEASDEPENHKQQPFSAWQAEVRNRNYPKPRCLVLPRAEGPPLRSRFGSVQVAPSPTGDASSQLISDDEVSLSEDQEPPEQRRARLRELVRERQVELRTLRVRWEMSQQSSAHTANCPANFLQQHVAFAIPTPVCVSSSDGSSSEAFGRGTTHQQAGGTRPLEGQRRYRWGEELSISSSEQEGDEETAGKDFGISRGEDGHFTQMLGSFKTLESQVSSRSRWSSSAAMPSAGRELWYASFASENHSFLQSRERPPRPPPVAPPPLGTKRVILLTSAGQQPLARAPRLEEDLQVPRAESAWGKGAELSAQQAQLAVRAAGANAEEWWLTGGVLFSRL